MSSLENISSEDDFYKCELVPSERGTYDIAGNSYNLVWRIYPMRRDKGFMQRVIIACVEEGSRFEREENFLPSKIRGEGWESIDIINAYVE